MGRSGSSDFARVISSGIVLAGNGMPARMILSMAGSRGVSVGTSLPFPLSTLGGGGGVSLLGRPPVSDIASGSCTTMGGDLSPVALRSGEAVRDEAVRPNNELDMRSDMDSERRGCRPPTRGEGGVV